MLRNVLRSSLKNPNMFNRYYVYGQSGRALMGNPEPVTLPKHIFQFQYAFDNYPDTFNAFTYIKHDKYVLHQTFSFENFEFRYDGEQWHMGSLVLNWLCFLFPVILYFIRVNENETAYYRRGTRTVHYQTQGGFLHDTWHISDDAEL